MEVTDRDNDLQKIFATPNVTPLMEQFNDGPKGGIAVVNDDLREANIRQARCLLEAINAWDFAAMRDLFAEKIVFEMPYTPAGFESRIEGLENVMAFLEQIPSTVVDGSENLHDIRIDTFGSDRNELVAEYKGAMKLKPTGAEYNNIYVARLSMDNGKITRFAEYYDPIRLVIALGGTVENPIAL